MHQHYSIKKGIRLICAILLLFSPAFIAAQRILYSPSVGNPSATRFEVAGKAGNYYWVQKSRKKAKANKPVEPWIDDRDLSFEVYDARMNLVSSIPYTIADTILKQYLVAGDEYFDRLAFTATPNAIQAVLDRYTPEGDSAYAPDTLATFPGSMKGNDFLLLRSQDKSKLLLLGFEPVTDAPRRLHAVLFNRNWELIYQTVYNHPNITQPTIQYDFISYPLEDFDNSPAKVANSGEWLMVSPSRLNSNNYLLFHFNGFDSSFGYKEIKLGPNASMQDLALSLDNEGKEAFAGILLNTRLPSVKKVRIAHYSFSQNRFDFDTAYRFSTVATKKAQDEYIFEQYFLPVPGKGFIFLKEYGRPFTSTYAYQTIAAEAAEDDEDTSMFNSSFQAALNKNDYTRYPTLAGTRNTFERGDLSFYYFPAQTSDSCWSGIINKAQTNELHAYLSYVFMPVEGKLVFLYNSLFNNDYKYGSSTILDQKGNALNEGLVFWQANNTLNFQGARQIAARELAIPYEKNGQNGFAVIRL